MDKEFQERRSKLVIYNSISRKKDKFVTLKPGKVLWYNCGPTVYDSSHMGHARSYISLDIIRRILAGYFGYHIDFVMNITDIDDKIIRKARQLHLFEVYKSEVTCGRLSASTLDEDIQKAITFYESKLTKEDDPDKKAMMVRLLEGCKSNQQLSVAEIPDKYKEILYEYLDSKNGSSVTNNEIFVDVPRKYEAEFFEDMIDLNVMDPNTLTRVSEYVPQIIDYISKIISNGYAYESNQSVYFDTVKFSLSPKHKYAKLEPESVGDIKAQSEGEGVLFSGIKDEKKHPNDFVLWKKSKPGEPSWESPWGKGRPGWHIECSVMASDTLGNRLDIHSGGCDLKFPHHDNEMAQSEAYYDTGDNWVNYFLHTGHLTISGCKMSKTLKNFVTIKDALKRNSWRQLRLAFLLHTWNDTLNYGDETMRDALSFEKRLNKFLWSIKWTLINLNTSNDLSSKERDLIQTFEKVEQEVAHSLCNNFATKSALESVRKLIKSTHDYLENNLGPNRKILLDVTHYIFDLMKIFGAWEKDTKSDLTLPTKTEEAILSFTQEIANFSKEMRQIGLDKKDTDIMIKCDQLKGKLSNIGVGLEDDEEISGKASATIKVVNRETLLTEIAKIKKLFIENGLPTTDMEEAIVPFVQEIANFRQEMRQIGLDKKDTDIMIKCDQLREKLYDLGVELEDEEISGKMFTVFQITDKETLKSQQEAERLEKERKKKELDEAQKAKDAKKSIPPTQLFINQTDKYSAFDERGLPTLDVEGKPISKSALKKLIKLYEQQEKKYEEYLKNTKEIC